MHHDSPVLTTTTLFELAKTWPCVLIKWRAGHLHVSAERVYTVHWSNDIFLVKSVESQLLNPKSHFLIATSLLLLANSISVLVVYSELLAFANEIIDGKSLAKSQAELLHLWAPAVLGSCWTLEEAIARVAQFAGGDEVIHHWFGLPWSWSCLEDFWTLNKRSSGDRTFADPNDPDKCPAELWVMRIGKGLTEWNLPLHNPQVYHSRLHMTSVYPLICCFSWWNSPCHKPRFIKAGTPKRDTPVETAFSWQKNIFPESQRPSLNLKVFVPGSKKHPFSSCSTPVQCPPLAGGGRAVASIGSLAMSGSWWSQIGGG